MELEISSPKTVSTASEEVNGSSGNHITSQLQPLKKKRNLAGMPDPNAEVVALSPTTLMATNRFVCEICNKGFQRDQNLQLHRRGHNLPWKLKQRTSNEVRKKVYLCPEPSCVHHDPARALGDLTGIKKHYFRKHGEKKWKCDRCSKKYAVQADWKAHMKTCGSRDYKCDCGNMFSRRDSFITHRAFCDALAKEGSRAQKLVASNVTEKNSTLNLAASSPPPPPPLTPSATIIAPVLSIHSPELPENPTAVSQQTDAATCSTTVTTTHHSSSSFSNVSCSTSVFASIFAPSTALAFSHPSHTSSTSFSHLLSSMSPSEIQTHSILSSSTTEPSSLCLSSPSLYRSSHGFSLFPTTEHDHCHFAPLSLQPAMSATALLQKAAQMGATASNGSFLRGLGLSMSSSSPAEPDSTTTHTQWSSNVKLESNSATAGLGLLYAGTAGLTDFMMGRSSSLYGTKPATLDLLGLGIGPSNPSTGGFSALLTSFGDELEIPASIGEGNSTLEALQVQSHRKLNGSALL